MQVFTKKTRNVKRKIAPRPLFVLTLLYINFLKRYIILRNACNRRMGPALCVFSTNPRAVGSTQRRPGKVEWRGTGPAVQLSFQQNGKTVVTVAGTLKTNNDQVTQDDIVTEGPAEM
jgi:hypothetical protein